MDKRVAAQVHRLTEAVRLATSARTVGDVARLDTALVVATRDWAELLATSRSLTVEDSTSVESLLEELRDLRRGITARPAVTDAATQDVRYLYWVQGGQDDEVLENFTVLAKRSALPLELRLVLEARCIYGNPHTESLQIVVSAPRFVRRTLSRDHDAVVEVIAARNRSSELFETACALWCPCTDRCCTHSFNDALRSAALV